MGEIRIFDAVMGTGKSTAFIKTLNHMKDQKFLILVPRLTEVTRYKEGLSADFGGSRNDIVALDQEDFAGSKKEALLEAVKEGKTVIATHKLFVDLNERDLECFDNRKEYTLILDETITLVDKRHISSQDLKDLEELGYVATVEHPSISGLKHYRVLPRGIEYLLNAGANHEQTMNAVSGKHVYAINSQNIVFVVPPEKLTDFAGVAFLTYLFSGSETNAWLDVFSLPYEHWELSRDDTAPLGVTLEKHTGIYSGAKLKSLLEIYDCRDINKVGEKKARAKGHPLTKSWYNERSKGHADIKRLAKNVRNFFGQMTKSKGAEKKDMLWTTFKDYRDWLRHSEFDPMRGDLETFLEQTARGTNDYDDRKYLAFLVDVYPPVELTTFFQDNQATFSRDNYALSRVLQWTWRSAIRKGEAITLYLPSARMRELLKGWLNPSVVS